MRTPLVLAPVLGAALALGLAAPAWAHVEIEPGEVKANTPTEVTLTVEHGCGNSPIAKVVTRLPATVVDVNGTGPDGWVVTIADGVVTWEGAASPVAEDLRLGLTFTARAEAGAVLGFPTIESCPNGEDVRWIEDVPDSASESVKPLPRLSIVAGAPAPATTAAAAVTTRATAAPAATAPAATTAATTATATTAPAATATAAPTTAIAPPTTVATDDGGVNSTGGVLAGFGAAAVVVAGAGVIYLRNRGKNGSGAR